MRKFFVMTKASNKSKQYGFDTRDEAIEFADKMQKTRKNALVVYQYDRTEDMKRIGNFYVYTQVYNTKGEWLEKCERWVHG